MPEDKGNFREWEDCDASRRLRRSYLKQRYLIFLRYFYESWKPFGEFNNQLHCQYRYLGYVSEMGVYFVFFVVDILKVIRKELKICLDPRKGPFSSRVARKEHPKGKVLTVDIRLMSSSDGCSYPSWYQINLWMTAIWFVFSWGKFLALLSSRTFSGRRGCGKWGGESHFIRCGKMSVLKASVVTLVGLPPLVLLFNKFDPPPKLLLDTVPGLSFSFCAFFSFRLIAHWFSGTTHSGRIPTAKHFFKRHSWHLRLIYISISHPWPNLQQ